MDQLGINIMKDNFDYNNYSRKKELFYCTVAFSKKIREPLILRFLILLGKYYPNYLICKDPCEQQLDWKDFVEKKSLKIEKGRDLTFEISPPLYIQAGEGELKCPSINNGFEFVFNEGVHQKKNFLLFNLYADLFTDKVYVFKEGRYIEENQSIAASKNRKLLSSFLKAMESFLDGEIIEFITDNHLTSESIFKYGIKEDAEHITEHMNLRN